VEYLPFACGMFTVLASVLNPTLRQINASPYVWSCIDSFAIYEVDTGIPSYVASKHLV
jgi:hypothetical protein